MFTFLSYMILFIARIIDNILTTAKTIMIQRNKALLAGFTVIISNFMYFSIMKKVVFAENPMEMVVVAVASGIGCCIAIMINNKFSKDRTFVNVVMSDDKVAMQEFRDFLVVNHITNVATDSYTKDWAQKTITITVYAKTKKESILLNQYFDCSPLKFKRLIQKL